MHLTRRLLAVLLLALLGCASAPPPKKVVQERQAPAPEDAVRAVLRRAYAAVEDREADRLREVFTFDAIAFGLAPSETYTSRDMLLERAGQELMPLIIAGEALQVTESNIRVGLAPDGQSAWLYDFPKVTWKAKDQSSAWLPRVTAHLVQDDGAWRIDALHLSLGVPDALIAAPDAARRYLPPFELRAERGKDSDQLIGLTKRLLEDLTVKVERTSDRDETALIGTDGNDVFLGGKAFKDLVRPKLAELKRAVFAQKIDGPLSARLAPGGKSGWVAANVVLRVGSGKKQITYPAFRALWIFVEQNEVWDLVSEHQSLALKADQREPASAAELSARKLRLEKQAPADKRGDVMSTFE